MASLEMNSMGGSELDARRAAYSQAVRHSQRVRRLKILLPASAVAISLIFVAVSIVRSLLPENIEVKGATIENGQIVMEKPAISGRNADGIFYSMTAARALQSIASPNIMTLENIAAQMPVNDQVIAKVNAKGGIYDRSANTLDMTQPFSLHFERADRQLPLRQARRQERHDDFERHRVHHGAQGNRSCAKHQYRR